MYTAIILKDEDHNRLLQALQPIIPVGWEILAHHMTINMGSAKQGPAAERLNEEVILVVKSFAINNKVCAVGVLTNVPSNNKIKHITLAVNRSNGGKPMHSNDLVDWEPHESLVLHGIVKEV